ncbi:hypothetical protein [Methanoculleus horonobensis]|jgi:hypothetical protein|uniref:hypothetical protein n=1 Tax=Methanoculleus horonobensis TaxID=528314 RepID=UPI00082F7E66|nr:hypothetical protein [Methanoculleus horonobensis]MDD3071306.1 hypothetical protein [Methanoculleus horonobensis]MDD4252547.1 hypothetical protein [Methanoculleus horonobensis]MDK2915761.1 hypothetical protein [Euryarchaeota archaeon]
MKRIIAAVMIVFLFLPGFAAAASGGYGGPGGAQAGYGAVNATPAGEEDGAGLIPAPGRGQQVGTEEGDEIPGERVQQRTVEHTPLQPGDGAPDRNRVRLAVHALLGAENRTGGIGENVSAIAREFNNSVEKTIRAEEQIRARHAFTRFLFGGDAEAARLIEEEAQRNRERVTELRGLIGNCTCDDATRTMLREQVRTIEQEQDRLETLASEEMQVRGLFSWR